MESGKILELSDCSLITLRQTVVSVSYLTALLKLMGDRHHRAELFYHNYPTYQTPRTATRNVEKLRLQPQLQPNTPKPQPKPKTQPKKQPPDVVVHAKIALQQPKKENIA